MYVVDLKDVTLNDVLLVGGKNASIGEMLNHLSNIDVPVPGGFAVTSKAFDYFVEQNNLVELIDAQIKLLDVNNLDQLSSVGKLIRQAIMDAKFPLDLEQEIRKNYELISQDTQASFAVRSSATAEDLPDASFAGQQETFLNVLGVENILHSIKAVFSSLYNDRAIAYRAHQGFDKVKISISAGIQRMVRSDLASSGVMFTIDTESGFKDVIFITASYGLGEMVVQGAVNPDEFYVYKPNLKKNKPAILNRVLGSKALKMVYQDSPKAGIPSVKEIKVLESDQNRFCINDQDIQILCEYATKIENHYNRPMDIEWAQDGETGEIFVVQARPETVKSRESNHQSYKRYSISSKDKSVLVSGRSIGDRVGSGSVKNIEGIGQINQIQAGDVLVTDMTDPDWEPVMKKAAAIVTNRGGRTCHAAIIARELGIPAVVGTGNATKILQTGDTVTVSCAEGDTGFVYQGQLMFQEQIISLDVMPKIPVDIMVNIANPDLAFSLSKLPNCGVGLARLEFIINRVIGIHPKALLVFDQLSDELQSKISQKTDCYASPKQYFIERLKGGIATIAAAFFPKPVIVRFSDFKSNEYASMLGGEGFEPEEENPMLGFRGASRYLDTHFSDCFQLECQAIQMVRDEMGLTNVKVMIPFVRTIKEAEQVLELLEKNGLRRGENGLEVIMMCELPSNAILATEFLKYFDGFSIGSNDMTQLTLGLDRDSGMIAHLFDERNEAVKRMIQMAIQACRAEGKYVGICGQAPSDHLEFAFWLIDQGISSISLNSDTVIQTWEKIDQAFRKKGDLLSL